MNEVLAPPSGDPAADRTFFNSPWARALQPLAFCYARVARWRRRRVQRRAIRLPVPVISVGNITTGGTGKTPVVEMIVRELLARGLTPGILSRGYRGERRGAQIAANDEFRVLAENLPEVLHVQDPSRVRGGRQAIEQGGVDCLVLDDGFQHVALARDLDIVLIDAVNPFGFGRVLPAGLLREPLATVAMADLLALTRTGNVHPRKASLLRAYLRARFPSLPQMDVTFEPLSWVDVRTGESLTVDSMKGRSAIAFAGIGNPEGFRRDLERLGLSAQAWIPFSDHHRYTLADVRRLADTARSRAVEVVVFTQKDAVKLRELELDGALSWCYLRIEARIETGRGAFESLLAGALR